MASDIRSQSQAEIDQEIRALTAKYTNVEWPFETREILSDCIASLVGLASSCQMSLPIKKRKLDVMILVRVAVVRNTESAVCINYAGNRQPG